MTLTERELRAMYRSLQFVEELIDYIAEYPDDDYMTMECLCRKLFKHGLIDKKDGYYLVADGITADRKTEPKIAGKHTKQIIIDEAVTEPSPCIFVKGVGWKGQIDTEPQTERSE